MATLSISCTLAKVLGAFHQLWKRTDAPGLSPIHSTRTVWAGNCRHGRCTSRIRRNPAA